MARSAYIYRVVYVAGADYIMYEWYGTVKYEAFDYVDRESTEHAYGGSFRVERTRDGEAYWAEVER